MKPNILIIEDEKRILNLLCQTLALEGYNIFTAENIREAFHHLKNENIIAVITDVKLPDGNGISVTEKIKNDYPDIEVIVLTAYANVSDAVKAMKLGAFDYLTKGENDDKLTIILERAVEKVLMKEKIKTLQERLDSSSSFDSITGKSPLLLNTIDLAKKVAATDSTVLLYGETGTGKELFAKAIHNAGKRKNKPFIVINCAAVPKELQESEFFGHKKGSFTGAIFDKKGVFEAANNGTLFLDEIGEMSLELQAKLLRAIEDKIIYRIGDTAPVQVDVRIITATNRDLNSEAQKGNFRKDFLYRLNSFTIEIPPLRNRKEDIELLMLAFVKSFSEKIDKVIKEIKPSFIEAILNYNYPGNIRELKGIIERAIILSEDNTLFDKLLPSSFFEGKEYDYSKLTLDELEKFHIIKVLKQTDNNKNESAKILGIGLTTLYRKLKDYNLE